MSKPIIVNSFASTIEKFIAEKRGIGLQYNGVSTYLQNFDRFSITFRLKDQVLTRNVVEAWLKQNPTQSQQTLRMKAIIIRQLGLYMKRMEMNAYVITEIPKRDHLFSPYIFSDKEIEGILTQADSIKTLSRKTSKHLVVPVFIRLLYFCGLRFSEVQQLRVKNVDLDNGILTIYGSKFDKDRLVPMSPEITNICRAYSEVVHVYSSKNAIYLPNVHNDVYEKRSFYNVYRDLLWMAGISQGGRGNGPRLHELSYPYINKTRAFGQKLVNRSNLRAKGSDNIYRFFARTPQNIDKMPSALRHFLGVDLSLSSSSVAKAFASCFSGYV